MRARRVLGALLTVGGAVIGCATGLDVTDAEYQEICAESQYFCEDEVTGVAGVGGAGALGGSNSPGGGNGGTAAGVSGNGVSGSANGGNLNSGGVFVTGGTQPTLNGGASGAEPLPLAEGECLDADDLIIVYTNRADGATVSNTASMTLRVQNPGAPFDLTTLTIRYWFTADGLTDFIGEIDYASQSGGQQLSGVTVAFGQELGSDYAEIGFTAGGSVGPEGVDTVQIRIHTRDYQGMFNHANDFSFAAMADSAPNRNLTPYINGVQVGGCVPIP